MQMMCKQLGFRLYHAEQASLIEAVIELSKRQGAECKRPGGSEIPAGLLLQSAHSPKMIEHFGRRTVVR